LERIEVPKSIFTSASTLSRSFPTYDVGLVGRDNVNIVDDLGSLITEDIGDKISVPGGVRIRVL